VAGVRNNPTIRAFYLRIRANGTHTKPALAACMRKFLAILNAHTAQQNSLANTCAHLLNLFPFPLGTRFPNTVAGKQHTAGSTICSVNSNA
jgi:hypothetical protein